MRSLALSLCLVLVAAIYKDEAGKYDWALTHVGSLNFADFIIVKDRSRLIVQSERGVLAALKMNGQIEWRKLPYGLDAQFFTLSAAGYLVTYAKDLEVLAAWDPEDGMLLWSASVKGAMEVVVKSNLASISVCALTQQSLIVINLATGKTIHTVALSEQFSHLVMLTNSDNVALVQTGAKLKIAVVDVNRGTQTSTLEGKLEGARVILTQSGVFAVKDDKVEWLAHLRIESTTWQYKAIVQVVPHSNVVIDSAGSVISTTTLRLIGTVHDVKLAATVSEALTCTFLHTNSFTTLNLDNGLLRSSELSLPDDSFTPAQLWAFRGTKGNDLLLIRGTDDHLLFIDQGKVKWQREEALGNAKSAVFVDLPGETLHAHNEYFISLTEKKSLPVLFATRIASQLQSLFSKFGSEQSPGLIMDNFGFNKLLIITTEVGKVFALHSMTGETVWTKQLMGCSLEHSISYDLDQFVLVAQCKEKTKLIVLSVLTGETLSDEPLQKPIVKVVEVEKEELKVLVLIGEDLSVTLFPKSDLSKELVAQQFLVFYIIEKNTGKANGYRITSSLTCEVVWSLQLPASEKIQAFKATSSGHIQQPAIATGLSKLLYKYLDSNLFVLATMKTKSVRDGEMTVYLVNGVTGRIISKIRQDGVAGKVSIDCDENWVVVHYWNYRSGRYEFLSIEMYEQKIGDSAWDMILSYLENSQTEVVSSYTRPPPVVLHQTYSTATGFQAIAHTATLQGITRQDLLLILNSGQVFTMDRRLLSPRRKPEEMPEISDFDDAALPPYKPLIPLMSTSILTHDRQVEGLEKFAVSWALLESTCFVAVYSLDLFVARVMPEKSFDMLTSDFNYTAIVLSIGVLVVATLVAEVYFKKSRVKRQFLG